MVLFRIHGETWKYLRENGPKKSRNILKILCPRSVCEPFLARAPWGIAGSSLP